MLNWQNKTDIFVHVHLTVKVLCIKLIIQIIQIVLMYIS